MTERTPHDVHHTLLNHIAVIHSYVQLLEDSDLDDDQRESLVEISKSVDQAHALATELGEVPDLHSVAEARIDQDGGEG